MTKPVDITPQIEMGEAILKKIEEMEKERDELRELLKYADWLYTNYGLVAGVVSAGDKTAGMWINEVRTVLEKWK